MENDHWLGCCRETMVQNTLSAYWCHCDIWDLNGQHLHIAHVQHYYVRVDIDWPNHMFSMSFDWKHYVQNVSNHHHVSLRNRFIILIDWLIESLSLLSHTLCDEPEHIICVCIFSSCLINDGKQIGFNCQVMQCSLHLTLHQQYEKRVSKLSFWMFINVNEINDNRTYWFATNHLLIQMASINRVITEMYFLMHSNNFHYFSEIFTFISCQWISRWSFKFANCLPANKMNSFE